MSSVPWDTETVAYNQLPIFRESKSDTTEDRLARLRKVVGDKAYTALREKRAVYCVWHGSVPSNHYVEPIGKHGKFLWHSDDRRILLPDLGMFEIWDRTPPWGTQYVLKHEFRKEGTEDMGLVFPHIPEVIYTVIVENKPRVEVFASVTSLQLARRRGKQAKWQYPGRRVLIIAYDKRSAHRSSRRKTWEVK